MTTTEHGTGTMSEKEGYRYLQRWYEYGRIGSDEFHRKYPDLEAECNAYFRASDTPRLADPTFPAPGYPHHDLMIEEQARAALLALNLVWAEDVRPPRWDAEANAWACSRCGSHDLYDIEWNITQRAVLPGDAEIGPAIIGVEGLSQTYTEAGDRERIECHACWQMMPMPGADREYVS